MVRRQPAAGERLQGAGAISAEDMSDKLATSTYATYSMNSYEISSLNSYS